MRNFVLECGAYTLEILVVEIDSFKLLRTVVSGMLVVQRLSRIAGHNYQVLIGNFEATFIESFCFHWARTHVCVVIILFRTTLNVCVGLGKLLFFMSNCHFFFLVPFG